MGREPVCKGLRERRTGGRGGCGPWRAATRAAAVGSAVSACLAPSTAHACAGRVAVGWVPRKSPGDVQTVIGALDPLRCTLVCISVQFIATKEAACPSHPTLASGTSP